MSFALSVSHFIEQQRLTYQPHTLSLHYHRAVAQEAKTPDKTGLRLFQDFYGREGVVPWLFRMGRDPADPASYADVGFTRDDVVAIYEKMADLLESSGHKVRFGRFDLKESAMRKISVDDPLGFSEEDFSRYRAIIRARTLQKAVAWGLGPWDLAAKFS